MSDAVAHAMWTLANSKSPVTQAQGGKAAKAGRAAARADGRAFRYQGPIPAR
jgi:hypothetical protein